METLQYTLVVNEDGEANVTLFVPGRAPLVAHDSHPYFEDIRAGVLANDESVIDLFDVALSAKTKFERLSERVSVAHGMLYFDGEVVNNALAEQVLRFIETGEEDWMPLVNFFENVQQNPEEHSREQLYSWLTGKEITITTDGLIVGYKGVKVSTDEEGDESLLSIHEGRAIVNGQVVVGYIPNAVGDIIEMPRSEVQFDPSVGCHQGLHVGNYRYANSFAQGRLLEVHVNPRDVVSVPTDSNAEKMRVCRYIVVGTIEHEYTQAVVDSAGYDFAYWGDGEDYDYDEDEGAYDYEDEDDAPFTVVSTFLFVDDEPVAKPEEKKVEAGDMFEDTDSRRAGRTLLVEDGTVDDDGKVLVTSLPLGIKRRVKLARLFSRKYKRA